MTRSELHLKSFEPLLKRNQEGARLRALEWATEVNMHSHLSE
jgi:hypothetical protein